jgi:amino acid transporter
MGDEQRGDEQHRPHPRRIARPHPPVNPDPSAAPSQERPASLHATQRATTPPAPESPRPTVTPASPPRLSPELELREVVRGQQTKSQFVRIMTTVPRDGFRRRASGVLQVTDEAMEPRSAAGQAYGKVKRLLVGTPLSTARLAHERLSKVKALAVFSSDALSSSAYATEEILIILALAGTGHLGLSIPIGLAIVALLAIVVTSYQQTIRAYPNGGGAFTVAKENLGELPGLAAGGALLVDYILTVSVSVAAGIAAIVSAVPELAHLSVEMGVAAIIIVTVLNLRGVTESATIFAFPTYAFIALGLALIVVGGVRVLLGAAEPVRYEEPLLAAQGLSLFLILKSFSSGCAALSGVEAVSNGVQSFKPPEWKNASATLIWMAVILGTMFFGITLLAHQYGLHEAHGETIVSQLGREVFGHNAVYYGWQAATTLILLLAANTSFAGFPALASLLAKDSYMPRQFSFRGDRLAYSNGIIVLSLASIIILIAFGASVTRLIPLYAVGVFTSFTLSQAGMLGHWRQHHGHGWRRSLVINGTGAVATAVVSAIIIFTKFRGGAWISILMGCLLVLFFRAVSKHYRRVDRLLALADLDTPVTATSRPQTLLVPVRTLNRPAVRALRYARSVSEHVTALHVTDDLHEAEQFREMWDRWAGGVPLVIIESPYRSFTQPLLSYIDSIDDHDPQTMVTVVLPEFVPEHWWQAPLHNQDALRLKAALLGRKDTVVIDVPQHIDE